MNTPNRAGAPKGKPQHKVNALTLAIMLEEMLDGPLTFRSLADVTGLGKASLYRHLRTFHAKGVIHIANWDKDAAGRVCVPVYELGRGKDARKRPKSKQEINREYAQRKRLRIAAEGLTMPLGTVAANTDNQKRAA